MPDFSSRSQEVEIMDDLNCSGDVVDQTLRELDTINSLLGGNYVTINGVKKLLAGQDREQAISIADLGCGSGDMLKLIRIWATENGYNVTLTGIDANPNIVAYARAHTSLNSAITYEAVDVFSPAFRERKFDIVIGTLFFHHFTSSQLEDFFFDLKRQVTIGIVVNDIHRHWAAFYSIRWLTRLFSRSAMVRFDAPLSVLRAFRKAEWVDILKKAEITRFTLRWMWAFRWQLIIRTK